MTDQQHDITRDAADADAAGFMIKEPRIQPTELPAGGLDPVDLIPDHYRRLPGDVKTGFRGLFPWLR